MRIVEQAFIATERLTAVKTAFGERLPEGLPE